MLKKSPILRANFDFDRQLKVQKSKICKLHPTCCTKCSSESKSVEINIYINRFVLEIMGIANYLFLFFKWSYEHFKVQLCSVRPIGRPFYRLCFCKCLNIKRGKGQ